MKTIIMLLALLATGCAVEPPNRGQTQPSPVDDFLRITSFETAPTELVSGQAGIQVLMSVKDQAHGARDLTYTAKICEDLYDIPKCDGVATTTVTGPVQFADASRNGPIAPFTFDMPALPSGTKVYIELRVDAVNGTAHAYQYLRVVLQ